jgi:hypothetical protein
MRRLKYLFAIAGVLALVLTSQISTSARDRGISHGKDVMYITEEHYQVTVCDKERDGNLVLGYVQTENGTRIFPDFNGSKGGCHIAQISDPGGVTKFRLCEEHVGCTRWYRA